MAASSNKPTPDVVIFNLSHLVAHMTDHKDNDWFCESIFQLVAERLGHPADINACSQQLFENLKKAYPDAFKPDWDAVGVFVYEWVTPAYGKRAGLTYLSGFSRVYRLELAKWLIADFGDAEIKILADKKTT